MIPYLKMEEFGKPLRDSQIKRMQESVAQMNEVMKVIEA